MKIIGSHDNGIVEDNSECLLKIEKGMLGVYTSGRTNYVQLNKPKNKKKWVFEKLNNMERFPAKPTRNNIFNPSIKKIYTHKIEYKTEKGESQIIFINPTAEEIIEIKSQLNKYWIIQPKFLKPIAIGLIIAFILWLAKTIFQSI